MFPSRIPVIISAKVQASFFKARYWGQEKELRDEELVNYIYTVTKDIKWTHWKSSVSADNTDVKSILRIADAYPAGSIFIEIGSWLGRTTCALGLLAKLKGKGTKVIAIDNFSGDQLNTRQFTFVTSQLHGNYFPIFWRNIEKFSLGKVVIPIKKISTEAVGDVAGLLAGKKAALIFIDGDHSEAGVGRDIQNYAPLVAPGGTIIFDDFSSPPVARAIARYPWDGWRAAASRENKIGFFTRLAD